MKKINLILLLVAFSLASCGLYRSIFSIVQNKFPNAGAYSSDGKFLPWKNENIFILSVELDLKNKVSYEKKGEAIEELTDFPLKDYKLITQDSIKSEKIVEEIYLYLSDFDLGVKKGSAVYMSTIPLEPKPSKLMFCNQYFISTYAINHVMDGNWYRDNSKIVLELSDKNNGLILHGDITTYDNELKSMIEFTQVNHPKPMNTNEVSLIDIRDVFEVNPNSNTLNNDDIQGIRFFQNKTRTLVHPDWNILKKRRFDYDIDSLYYLNNYEKRKIDSVIIKPNKKSRLYFKMADSSIVAPNNIIRYPNN